MVPSSLNLFCFENGNFVKSDQLRRTLEFLLILHMWPMKCFCNLYCTYMWLVRIHGIGDWARLLGFGLGAQLFSILWFMRRTWLKMIIEGQLLMNPLWIRLIWLSDEVWMVVRWWMWCLWSYVVFVPLFGL